MEMGVMIALVASAILGAMIFFATVVAPLVFKALDAEDASRFLRTLFPVYYVAFGIAGLLGIIPAALNGDKFALIVFAVFSALMFFGRTVAVPVINRARDEMLAGDPQAKRRFGLWHGGTVVVNLVQMVMLASLIVAAGWPGVISA